MNDQDTDKDMREIFDFVGQPETFKPFAYYNKDGDCIEFFSNPEPPAKTPVKLAYQTAYETYQSKATS